MKSNHLLFAYFILFYFVSFSLFSQATIKANVSVDKNGNMRVRETLNNVSTEHDTLVFNKNINLEGNEEKLIRGEIFRNSYFNYINSDGSVNYSIKAPKSSFHNFFFHDSIYFISANYLGVKKQKYNIKKRYNLNIDVPEGYSLIYPQKEDLEEKLYSSPPIITGVFEEFEYNDFCVYYRPNLKYDKQRMNDILNTIENSFNHFQKVFSKKEKDLEIIFLPFKSKIAGKNLDNLIILNENLLTNSWLNKKTLIHETLHQWWGDNSIRFQNPVLTEAITEFLTLDYLDIIQEKNYLKRQLEFKKNKVKGIRKYDFRYSNIKNSRTYKLYSYDLLPLLMWSKKNESNIKSKLIEFYKKNKGSFISNKEGQNLINRLNIRVEFRL